MHCCSLNIHLFWAQSNLGRLSHFLKTVKIIIARTQIWSVWWMSKHFKVKFKSFGIRTKDYCLLLILMYFSSLLHHISGELVRRNYTPVGDSSRRGKFTVKWYLFLELSRLYIGQRKVKMEHKWSLKFSSHLINLQCSQTQKQTKI